MPAAELSEDENTIWVLADYTENQVMKMVPGMNWDGTHRMWRAPASFACCLILRELFGERLAVGQHLSEWSVRERSKSDWRMWARESRGAVQGNEGWPLPEFRDPLFGFQQAAAPG